MAKDRSVPVVHTYQVIWNAARRSFDVERDGLRLGSFARDKNTAVGLAIKEAELEHRGTLDRIIVTSTQDGKRVVEWSSH